MAFSFVAILFFQLVMILFVKYTEIDVLLYYLLPFEIFYLNVYYQIINKQEDDLNYRIYFVFVFFMIFYAIIILFRDTISLNSNFIFLFFKFVLCFLLFKNVLQSFVLMDLDPSNSSKNKKNLMFLLLFCLFQFVFFIYCVYNDFKTISFGFISLFYNLLIALGLMYFIIKYILKDKENITAEYFHIDLMEDIKDIEHHEDTSDAFESYQALENYEAISSIDPLENHDAFKSYNHFEEKDLFQESHIPEPSEKYQRSKMKDAELENIQTKVSKLMDEKVFLDPELSLSNLADSLEIPKYNLSQFFNIAYKCNFKEYINKLRCEHAIKHILDQKTEDHIINIAYSSGFNSKTSFYRAFNKIYKCTPLEYRQRNLN